VLKAGHREGDGISKKKAESGDGGRYHDSVGKDPDIEVALDQTDIRLGAIGEAKLNEARHGINEPDEQKRY
jgi:hypothetical protein